MAALAPSTEICTHSTPSAARRSAARSSMRLPSVSILSATPPSARRSKSSQQWGTPSGSPPPPPRGAVARAAARRRASPRASPRSSSSRQARSGPDSSQQAMQRALHRFVSCQARKRGARYSPTARPGISDCRIISGKADVRLGHHLLGNVLHPGRLPVQALGRVGLLGPGLLLLFPQIRFGVTHVGSEGLQNGVAKTGWIQNSRISLRRRDVPDALVAVDAGRLALEHLVVHRLGELLLLLQRLGRG